MTISRLVACAIAGLLALLFIAPLPLAFGLWAEEIRYRVTVEIDTPDGMKSGSSVIGVRRSNPPGPVELGLGLRHLLVGGSLYPSRYYGDAPFVDLGGGRNAIMLVGKGFDWHTAPFEFLGIRRRATGDMFGPGHPDYLQLMDDIWAGRALPTEKAEIATPAEIREKYKALGLQGLDDAPFVITFRNIRDPETAAVLYTLDPSPSFAGLSDPRKAFEEAFGPGYAYRRATIEFVRRTRLSRRGSRTGFHGGARPCLGSRGTRSAPTSTSVLRNPPSGTSGICGPGTASKRAALATGAISATMGSRITMTQTSAWSLLRSRQGEASVRTEHQPGRGGAMSVDELLPSRCHILSIVAGQAPWTIIS